MIFSRLLKSRDKAERRLYGAIVAAARRPAPYASWGVPDTVDGRFDMISLHLFLVLDRLKGAADQFRQNLVDEFFLDMDRSLREMGVGDLSVGKKVRKMAESFYGRVAAYEKALSGPGGALRAALARNVFPDGAPDGAAEALEAYALGARAALAGQPVDAITGGTVNFPEPEP